MIEEHVILSISWLLFCVLHSVLAAIGIKQLLKTRLGKHFKFYRLYYTLFAFISFLAVVVYQIRLESPLLFTPATPGNIAGGVIMFAGLVIMGICIKKYFGQLSGLKTLFIDEVKSGNTLLITGIHRFVRHPLYLGTFLFIWGLFLLIPLASVFISNFIITIYTLVGISFEEAKLINEFGEPYKTYQNSVPKIIPAFRRKANK